MVVALAHIQQFSVDAGTGRVRNAPFSISQSSKIRNSLLSVSSIHSLKHLPQISNPVASTRTGWETEDSDQWSDSPEFQPYLLYRHRFSWGRDNVEIFTPPPLDAIPLGGDGHQWGNLDDASGLLMYWRVYSLSSSTTIRQTNISASAKISNKDFYIESDSDFVYQLGEVAGETTIRQFPYLILAIPEPFSVKNAVDTNVFIRIANFANPINPETIKLFIEDVERVIQITEFFSGNGGFDILWTNDEVFPYGGQVDVRLEFRDTDSPTNRTIIEYPFFTVEDLAHPRIANKVPADDTFGVSIRGPIQFDVLDFESGVDLTTLRLYVNGFLVINGVNGELTVTEINDGYTVKFVPYEAWNYGDLIAVAIFVRDLSENHNELFEAFSFTTSESTPPEIINPVPESCAADVPVETNVQVDVIDGGHGLDTDTVKLEVNETEKPDILKIPIIHRED